MKNQTIKEIHAKLVLYDRQNHLARMPSNLMEKCAESRRLEKKIRIKRSNRCKKND
jgi:hypothetical protein